MSTRPLFLFIKALVPAKLGSTYEERVRNSEDAMSWAWKHAFGETGVSSWPRLDFLYAVGPLQNSFLLTGKDKDRYMLEHGYIKGKEKDYGLVKKAVGERDLPVYLTAPDDVDRKYLVPIGNPFNDGYGQDHDMWFGQDDAELWHAGSYPSTLYVDGRNPDNMYQKAWDLGINNDTYILLAKYSLGILGAETNYGEEHNFVSNFAHAVMKKLGKNHSSPDYRSKYNTYKATGDNNSIGLTQIRYSNLSDEQKRLLTKYGITKEDLVNSPEKAAVATLIKLATEYKNSGYNFDRAIGSWNLRDNYIDRVKRNTDRFEAFLRRMYNAGGSFSQEIY